MIDSTAEPALPDAPHARSRWPRVERLSPVVRAGRARPAPTLADFGVDGPPLRPAHQAGPARPGHRGPHVAWPAPTSRGWPTWLDLPVEERGHMRTYTIRDVRGSGAGTRSSSTSCCTSRADAVGPGSLLGGRGRARRPAGDGRPPPRRRRSAGIEFDPGTGRRSCCWSADETAVPAVCRILERPAAHRRSARPSSRCRRPATCSTCGGRPGSR